MAMQPAVERHWRPPHLRGSDGVASDDRRRFPSQPVNNRTREKGGARKRGERKEEGWRGGGRERVLSGEICVSESVSVSPGRNRLGPPKQCNLVWILSPFSY